MNSDRTDLWTIILAAGAGRRLSPVTGLVPKQFWRGSSNRSLLEATIDRFEPLAPRSQTIVIVDAKHERHLETQLLNGPLTAVFQPEDRGTAAGVLLALTPVLASDPDAMVVMTPSDHGVANAELFRQGIRRVIGHARARDTVVLFGVEPTGPRDDYGWIVPGMAAGTGTRIVDAFVEKPVPDVASRLLSSGAVWNTMVVVARAGRLRDLCFEQLPGLADVFAAGLLLPESRRVAFWRSVYPALPHFDFSRDVLATSRQLATYVWPAAIGWSDLGTPDRLAAWDARGSAA